MKYLLTTALVLLCTLSVFSQPDVHGEWVGFIVDKGKQYYFELNIFDAKGKNPGKTAAHFDINGSIIDARDSLKTIDIYGFINRDYTINAYDTKIIEREYFEKEFRARYQFHVETRNGEPWMIGYWQDYNYKGHEQAKGRIFLKRKEKGDERA